METLVALKDNLLTTQFLGYSLAILQVIFFGGFLIKIIRKRVAGNFFNTMKYPTVAVFALAFFAIFSYNFPENYQLANLIEQVKTTNWGITKTSDAIALQQTAGNLTVKSQDTKAPENRTIARSQSRQKLVLAVTDTNIPTNILADQAENKKTIQLAGVLTDNDGKLIEGEYAARFSIYTTDRTELDPYPSDSDKNQRVWEETQVVNFKKGIFHANLGGINALPVFTKLDAIQFFVGIRIGEDSEMVPRRILDTPFFAFNSANALMLNGKKVGATSGDIVALNNRGKVNIKNLPTGTTTNQLVLGDDERLDEMTVSGASFIQISGQSLTASEINLTSDTQGTLATDQGGLGLSSYSIGDMLYFATGSAMNKLAIGADGQFLSIVNGLPAWQNYQATVYTRSGTLLQLTSNNFSIREGTLTNAKLCTYDATVGIVCDTDPTVETDPTISAWAKNGTKPTYTATEIGLGNVPNLTFSGSNTGDETSTTLKTKLGSATTTTDGYLTTTDWNTFNNKQPAGSYLTTYSETDPIFNASQAHNITVGYITILNNTSGTNSGDNAVNTLYSGLAGSKQDILTNPILGTGTTNYLAKFTGTSSLASSILYDDGANIGIGTTSPNEKLEINGRLLLAQTSAPSTTTNRLYNVSGSLYWNGVNVTTGGSLPSATTGQTMHYNGSGWVASSIFKNDGTNLEISGNILPEMTGGSDKVSVRSIGDATHRLAHLWADEVHIGASSLYVNDKKVIEDVSSTMNFKTDIDQAILVKTQGIGMLTLQSDAAALTLTTNNILNSTAKGGMQ